MRASPVAWRLARPFIRSDAVRALPLALGIVIALLIAAQTCLSSLGLSQAQLVARDLGPFDGSAQIPLALREDTQAVGDVVDALSAAGAEDPAWVLESMDLRLTGGDGEVVQYREAAWASGSLGNRYVLLDGRWPSRPGEVVLTRPLAGAVSGGTVDVLSGTSTFQVTGTVEDHFVRTGREILAAPGTWTGQDWAWIGKAFPSVAGSVTVLWHRLSSDEALEVIAATMNSDEEGLVTTALSLVDRSELLSEPDRSLADLYPTAYAVPAAFLPVVLTVLALAVGERRLRRAVGIFRMVGISARDATLATWGVGMASVVAAAVLGAVVGAFIGWAVRPVVAVFSPQPLSPFGLPVAGATQAIGLVALTCVIMAGTAAVMQSQARAAMVTAFARPAASLGFLRHVLVAVTAVAVLWAGAHLRTLFDIVTMTVASTVLVALVTPTVMRILLRTFGETSVLVRLAKRQMQDGGRRTTTAATVIAVTVGPALAMVTLLGSVQAGGSALSREGVGVDQVYLSTGSLFEPPPDHVVDLAAAEAPGARAVAVYALGVEEQMVTSRVDGLGLVHAFDTVNDVADLCGGALTDDARTVLAGGVLYLGEGSTGDGRLWAHSGQPASPGPAASIACPGWERDVAAVTLTETARNRGLPVHPSGTVLVGVTPDQVGRILGEIEDYGYPVSLARHDAGAQAMPIPMAAWLGVAVPVALALGCAVVSGRAQVRALAVHLPVLRAIGLTSQWAQSVVRLQVVLVVAIGAALGLTAAAVPVVTAHLRLDDVNVVVPWVPAGALIVLVLAVAAATSLRVRHAGPRRRRHA